MSAIRGGQLVKMNFGKGKFFALCVAVLVVCILVVSDWNNVVSQSAATASDTTFTRPFQQTFLKIQPLEVIPQTTKKVLSAASTKHLISKGKDSSDKRILKEPRPTVHSEPLQKPTTNTPRGYIITQSYNGQMTRAIRNMMGQQCWAWSLGKHKGSVSVVEPFSSESKLWHLKRFWDAYERDELYEAVHFSKYFDIDHYNKLSVSANNSPIVLWDKFLSDFKTPRDIILVMLPVGKCTLSQSKSSNNSAVEMPSSSCSVGKQISDLTRALKEKHDVSISKKICIDCSVLKRQLTFDELQDMIYGGGDVSKFIVVMNTWRNFAYTQNWLEVPSNCRAEESPKSSDKLVSSKAVIAHSNIYKEKFIKSKRVVAIMFRIERFLTLKVLGHTDKSLSTCIKETLSLHDKLLNQDTAVKSNTFLTLDIGRFGSGLMQTKETVSKYNQSSLESIEETVQNMLGSVFKGQFKSLHEWEESFIKATGGITERGYISMLQRDIATKADCLILMGGGSYQQVAVQQYIANHPDPSRQCIHAVCVSDSFKQSLP